MPVGHDRAAARAGSGGLTQQFPEQRGGFSQLMRQGELVCLAGGQAHSVTAVDDSSMLVTILLHAA